MQKIRKEVLRELLIGIYKTERVNYENYNITIEEIPLFKKFSSSKIQSLAKIHKMFQQLLELTFLNKNTIFRIDNNGRGYNSRSIKEGQIQFSKKYAIDNAYNYLTSKGVSFVVFGKSDYNDIYNIEKIIFDALCIFLNYIFYADVDRYIDTENANASKDDISANAIASNDDISAQLRGLITEVNFMLSRIALGINCYEHTSDDNSVVEIREEKKNCNFFLSVGIKDLGMEEVVPIFTVTACAHTLNKKKDKKERSDNSGKESIDWLMSNFGRYDLEIDLVFKLSQLSTISIDKDTVTMNPPSNTFSISRIQPNPDVVNKFEVYFLFKIDKDKITTFYPNVKTPYDLCKALIARNHEQLSKPFNYKIKNYYRQVMMYIDDVLEKVLAIDFEKLIAGDVDESILSVFDIDYDYMINYFKSNEVLDEKNLYLYLMIDRALHNFTDQLNIYADVMARQISVTIDIDEVATHMEKLMKFISSDKIKDAVVMQEYDEKEHPEKYRFVFENMPYDQILIETYTKKTRGLFKSLIKTVEKYYFFLLLYKK